MRAAGLIAVLAAAAALLVGCSTPAGGTGPRFLLDGDPTGVWEPVHIRLVSLPPGERVTIAATAVAGHRWSTRATYAVPADGVVDLARQAPLEAPWSGADGMGLFWSLRAASGAPADSAQVWGASTWTVRLEADVAGRRVAVSSVHRVGLGAAAPSRAVFDDGITGDYFRPVTATDRPRPAVIVFDGTDPGTPTGVLAASTLSALGFPALALSTYGSAGDPDPRHVLPAERFLAAVHWLRSQPGVDPSRIFTFGTSRGAQLALWAAVAYPGTVYGAIAPGGTTGLVCTSPVPSPAVTVDGDWVPCTTGTTDVSTARVLDLSRIPGPVVLGCAGADEQLSNGCAWMDAAAVVRPPRPEDAYLRAPDATHLFYLPPYTPLELPAAPHAQATEDARVALWGDILVALDGSAPAMQGGPPAPGG